MVNSINLGYGSYQAQPNGIIPQNNVHQSLKNKYGVGYEDFGTTPYAQPFPAAISARRKEPVPKKNQFVQYLKSLFFV